MILCDSSIKDPEQNFYVTSDELSQHLSILMNLIGKNQDQATDLVHMFELLKKVKVMHGGDIYEKIHIKAKILLQLSVEYIQEEFWQDKTDLIQVYYELLNSYTLELKKVEV